MLCTGRDIAAILAPSTSPCTESFSGSDTYSDVTDGDPGYAPVSTKKPALLETTALAGTVPYCAFGPGFNYFAAQLDAIERKDQVAEHMPITLDGDGAIAVSEKPK